MDSGALNSGEYGGNTILLQRSSVKECKSLDVTNSKCNEFCFGETIQTEGENNFTSGFEIVRFFTEDQIFDFISLMSNNMVPTNLVVQEK